MRTFSVAILLALSIQQISAQSAQELIRLNNVNGINSIQSPLHKGNMAYESGEKKFYYRDNSAWVSFKPWELDGNNTISPANYVGTSNYQHFRIRTNNTERMIVTNTGVIGIGNDATFGLFSVGSTLYDGVLPKMTSNNDTILGITINDYPVIVSDFPFIVYATTVNEPYLAFDNDPDTYWEMHVISTTAVPKILLDFGSATNGVRYDGARITRFADNDSIPRHSTILSAHTIFFNSFQDIHHSLGSSIDTAHWPTSNNWTHSWNYLQDFSQDVLSNTTTPERRYNIFSFSAYNNLHRIQVAEIDLLLKVPEFGVFYNGNTSLGIDIPTERLHIAGDVVATSITPTPDYVFETYYDKSSSPPYEWMPLEKTKAFIEKNHHLPNVKSAKQIEKEGGILLNEAIPKNLEKIEEAFIYVFELNNRLKKLEEKIKNLEN